MKVRFASLLILISAAFSPIIMPAAELPVLKGDGNITVGVLENGITYYVVPNKTEAGRLDISLLQKFGYSSEDSLSRGLAVVHSIGSLASLPRFRSPSPIKYLVQNRIWPTPGGYVTIGSDATVYNFRNIPVQSGLEAADSTLLMVFEIIKNAPDAAKGHFPNKSQAIIISGDITLNAALSKLNMLSMLVEKREKSIEPKPYEWVETPSPRIKYTCPSDPALATISFTWRAPRTPGDQINTIQPLVTGMFFRELETLAEKRLSRQLGLAGLGFSSLSATYTGSEFTDGDELFTVTATVAPKDLRKASRVIIDVMASIGLKGSVPLEYRDIRQNVRSRAMVYGSTAASLNVDYTQKCINSFLYGTSLATRQTRVDYLVSRNLDEKVSLDIFNSFASALLSPSKNLDIECRADSTVLGREDLKSLLRSDWKLSNPDKMPEEVALISDTLHLSLAPAKKIRIVETAADPMSDATVFTLSNGIRVVFKQTAGEKIFRYSWNQKGGYSMVSSLHEGEGAYVGDMLFTGNIGSTPGRKFKGMLSANGITMTPEVGVNGFAIRGTAPNGKLLLTLKALASVAFKRSSDSQAYEQYVRSQKVASALTAVSPMGDRYVLDSLLCPKGLHDGIKSRIHLSKNLPSKAEEFYQRQFKNMSNGVLVIVGSFDEQALRKVLLSTLNRFPDGKASAPRFRSNSQFSTGRKVLNLAPSRSPRVSMGYTMEMHFDLTGFITSGIINGLVEDAVSKAVVPLGWSCRSEWDLKMFPDERLFLRLYLHKADYRGLPATLVSCESSDEVLAAAENAVKSLGKKAIASEEFNNIKAYMTNDCVQWTKDNDYLVRLFELRYNYGKDFVSGIKEKSGAILADDVRAQISKLAQGGFSAIVVPMIKQEERIVESAPALPPLPGLGKVAEPSDSTGFARLFRQIYFKEVFPENAFIKVREDIARIMAEREAALEAERQAAEDAAREAAAEEARAAALQEEE